MICSITKNKRQIPLVRSESGSFTVESTVVFPAVFLAVLALLFGAMIIHERVLLYHSASAAAEKSCLPLGQQPSRPGHRRCSDRQL